MMRRRKPFRYTFLTNLMAGFAANRRGDASKNAVVEVNMARIAALFAPVSSAGTSSPLRGS